MKKIILRTLLALFVIIVIGLILLPGLATNYAINHSKERIGRQIDMDKLKVNYFSSKITATNFKMFEADEKEIFIAFDTLIVDLKPFQLFFDVFVMEQFYLKGLETTCVKYDSTFNFDDLIAFHKNKKSTPETDSSANEPIQFHLSNIQLNDAKFIFDNKPINHIADLEDISFSIPYIGWDQEEKSEADFRFIFENDGYFESSINADPIGGDFDAEITLHTLKLDAFQEYLKEYVNIDSFQGVFNSSISISGNIKEAEKSLLSGNVEVLDFLLKDNNSKEFLGVKKLDCKLDKIDLFNAQFIADSVIVSEPYVYFELKDSSNNFSTIFNTSERKNRKKSKKSNEDPALKDSSKKLYYAINSLIIDKGVIDYKDKLTDEPFDYHLSNLKLNSDSIFSTSEWLDIYSTMLLNNRGKLVAEVGFNPSNPYEIKLDYVITDFQLTDLNIYSRFYMGFPILYGDMYYKSHTQIVKNQLSSENKLVIHNAELGDKKGGLFDLPVKFALFLLKDRHGVIDLDVPVRGDLNDPKVNLRKIIWKTFKNLIVKVATAPFDFLAGLITVDPKDIKSIDYKYLDTLLTPKIQRQLDLLLELEQKKEGLDIKLVYFNDTEKEKTNLAKVFEEQSDTSETTLAILSVPEESDDLTTKTGVDSPNLKQTQTLAIDQPRIDSLITLYAQTRKSSIENYLYSKNDSTQIQFTIPDERSPKNVGSFPHFEVKYSMKGYTPED